MIVLWKNMSRASAAKAKLQLLHTEIIANWTPHTTFVSICQLPLVHVGPAKERQPKALEIYERYPCTMAYTPDSPRDAIATQDAIHTDIFMDGCLHHNFSYEGGCMSDWVTRSFLQGMACCCIHGGSHSKTSNRAALPEYAFATTRMEVLHTDVASTTVARLADNRQRTLD
jgi:hypothetical protein